jgi:hypothetical protein
MLHPKPSVVPLRRRSRMMGHRAPPVDDPEMVIPIANERRLRNQDWAETITGSVIIDQPTESKMPCTITKCQYFVQRDHIMKAKPVTIVPAHIKYYSIISRPDYVKRYDECLRVDSRPSC